MALGPEVDNKRTGGLNPVMKGKISAYSHDVKAGVIEGSDGQPYYFALKNWRSETRPRQDCRVEFIEEGRNVIEVREDNS